MSTRSRLLAAVLVLATLVALAPAAQSAPGPRRAAVPAHHPDLVLVAFHPGAPAGDRADVHRQEGGRVEHTMPWLDLDVVRIGDGDTPTAAAARYDRNPNVAYAHPNWVITALRTPNDPRFGDLWGLHNTGQAVSGSSVTGVSDVDIDAPEGWDVLYPTGFTSSGGRRVGIVDTGIDQSHADLQGKTNACASALTGTGIVTVGTCVDDNLHGTHVAGTVAALADNGLGVAGVAPGADLAVFKALNSAGTGFYADVIAGIQWVGTTGGADIISMSLGGPQDDALDRQLATSWNDGELLVAAAGNDGDSTPSYPAFHPDVVSVGAIDAAGNRASFSNCNGDVEVAAPGVDVWSTIPGGLYAALDGTSMATPHVSGVASAVWTLSPTLTNSQVRSTITTKTAGSGGCNGVGVVNLAAALGGTTTTEPSEPSSPGAIAGTVTDQRSKQAIGGALVDCGAAGSDTTSADGTYEITGVAAGIYDCQASASGYRSKSATASVTAGATTTLSFALRAR